MPGTQGSIPVLPDGQGWMQEGFDHYRTRVDAEGCPISEDTRLVALHKPDPEEDYGECEVIRNLTDIVEPQCRCGLPSLNGLQISNNGRWTSSVTFDRPVRSTEALLNPRIGLPSP